MPRLSCLPRALLLAATAAGVATWAAGHGIFEKAFYSQKTNAATRGAANGKATRLYMMQPHRYLTGEHSTVGWRLTLQDEEASTIEPVELAYVAYAANGVDPDATATGTLVKAQFRLFGLGMKGTTAFNFLVTIGRPLPLPRNFGIAIRLPAAPQWPKDGPSIHAQLNLPNDSRRSRVPAPWDTQVFAFEEPEGTVQPISLGGRCLDVLDVTGQYIEPVLRVFNRSAAYGLGREDLFGPEALHPWAARGDELGITLDGGQIGVDGWAIVFVAPGLLKDPVRLPPAREWWLDFTDPLHVPVGLLRLDSLGRATAGTLPLAAIPAGFRSFWLQAVIANPWTFESEFTDAVGVQGL